MKYLAIPFLAFSLSAFAWTPNGQTVTIVRLWQWNLDTNYISDTVFETSAGHFCYIPNEEKAMFSLVLAVFTSGKNTSIHCYDSEETIHGKLAHRVHRVIAVQ